MRYRVTSQSCTLCSASLLGVALVLVSALAGGANNRVVPMETRPADTLSRSTLDFGFQYFTDVKLQEADEFDGWTADLDLRIPFMERFQLRLYLPLYTMGDATLQKDTPWEVKGDSLHIGGWTGIYDFASVEFEHQLLWEQDTGVNLGYFVGLGSSLKPLETDLTDGDKYNHRGRVAMLGLKTDSMAWGGKVRMLGNLGFRYYLQSDDLNPGGDDTFGAVDLKAAAVFPSWGQRVYPVVELTYLGDFNDLNVATLYPELIYPIADELQFKGAAPIGLGGDGSRIGLSAQLSWSF